MKSAAIVALTPGGPVPDPVEEQVAETPEPTAPPSRGALSSLVDDIEGKRPRATITQLKAADHESPFVANQHPDSATSFNPAEFSAPESEGDNGVESHESLQLAVELNLPSVPESWAEGIGNLGLPERDACIKLLRTKSFRSSFRQSLCMQLKTWLDTEPADRKYLNPFSPKQWNCLRVFSGSRAA